MKKKLATLFAIAAAALYAINIPFSKALMAHVEPTMMAAFLHLGAGAGLLICRITAHAAGRARWSMSTRIRPDHTYVPCRESAG